MRCFANLILDEFGSVALSSMSLDTSQLITPLGSQYSKVYFFFQRSLFGISLRTTQVLRDMNYVFSFLAFKSMRFFSDVITKHKLKTK